MARLHSDQHPGLPGDSGLSSTCPDRRGPLASWDRQACRAWHHGLKGAGLAPAAAKDGPAPPHSRAPDLGLSGSGSGDDLIKARGHVSTFLKPLSSLAACGAPVGTSSLTPAYLICPGRTLLGAERGLGMPARQRPSVLTRAGRADSGFLLTKLCRNTRTRAPKANHCCDCAWKPGPSRLHCADGALYPPSLSPLPRPPSPEAGLRASSVAAHPQGPLSMSQSQRPIMRLGPRRLRTGGFVPGPRAGGGSLLPGLRSRPSGRGGCRGPVCAPSAVTVARSQGWEEGDCPREDPRGCCQGPCMWPAAPDLQGHLSGHAGLPARPAPHLTLRPALPVAAPCPLL